MGFLRNFLRARKEPREKIMVDRLRLGKGLLRSKTFWVNLLTGIAVALGAAGSIPFLPVTIVPWLGAALAIANILLRVMTDKPITSVK